MYSLALDASKVAEPPRACSERPHPIGQQAANLDFDCHFAEKPIDDLAMALVFWL